VIVDRVEHTVEHRQRIVVIERFFGAGLVSIPMTWRGCCGRGGGDAVAVLRDLRRPARVLAQRAACLCGAAGAGRMASSGSRVVTRR
jgi:hypothetical protein